MPYIIPNNSVSLYMYTDNNASGGDGGTPFTFLKDDEDERLTKITVWQQGWRITGVEVWMADDSNYLVGKRECEGKHDPLTFKFKKGELITKLNIQASGKLGKNAKIRVGALEFETNLNRKFGVHSSDLNVFGEYRPDVGSGICCGIFGAHDSEVHRLGFAMLKKKPEMVKLFPYAKLDEIMNGHHAVFE